MAAGSAVMEIDLCVWGVHGFREFRSTAHMTHVKLLPSVALCVVPLLALGACVAPTNEYDPSTPQDEQRPALVSGVVRDLADAPVVGAEVAIGAATSTTGEDGAFSFELMPDDVQVRVSHPAFVPQVESVTLSPGQEAVVDFVLAPLPQQAGDDVGHLFGEVHRAGQLSLPAAEQDHAGVVVEVVGTGVRTVSNPAGAFDLFLQPGSYSLSFTTAGHTEIVVDDVEVAAGEDKLVVGSPFVLQGIPGSVRGQVRLEGGGDADNVAIDLAGGGSGVTDAAGAFIVSDIAAGSYLLTATKEGFDAFVFGFVDVRPGQETLLPAFVLDVSRGTVSGVVQLAGQDDHSGIVIDVGGGQGTAVTSTDGAFVVNNVREGSYALTARKDGYVTTVLNDVAVTADGDTDVGALTLAPQQGDFTLAGGAVFTAVRDVSVDVDVDNVTHMRVSEDPDFADAQLGDTDFVAFADDVEHTLSDGDGLKTVYAQVRDADGVESALLSSQITLDATAPIVDSVVINAGASATNAADGIVSLALAATDATSGVGHLQISNDDIFDEPFVPYTTSTTHTLAAVDTDGDKTVYVRVRDFAGNVSEAASTSITLDTLPPTVTSFSIGCGGEADAAACNSPIVTLHVDTDDAVAMAVGNEAGIPNAVFKPFATTSTHLLNPGDGTQSVYLQLRDAAGNLSNVFADDVLVDTVPPALASIELAGGAVATSSTSVTVALSATGATQMRVAFDGVLDDETPVPYTTSAMGTLPMGDGRKYIAAVFYDDAGNSSAVVQTQIALDTQAPSAPLTQQTDVTVNADTYTVYLAANSTSADDPNFSHYELATTTPLRTPQFVPTALLDGLHFVLDAGDDDTCPSPCRNELHVRAVDAAGNTSAVTTVIVDEDSTFPSTPRLAPRGARISNRVALMRLEDPSIDNGDDTEVNGYEVIGGRYDAFMPVASSTVIPFELDRLDFSHQLCVRGRDKAGNVSPTDCVTIEQRASTFLASTGIDEQEPSIYGDLIAYINEDFGLVATNVRGDFEQFLDNDAYQVRLAGDDATDTISMAWVSSGHGAFVADIDVNNMLVGVASADRGPCSRTCAPELDNHRALDIDGDDVVIYGEASGRGGVFHVAASQCTAADVVCGEPAPGAATRLTTSGSNMELCESNEEMAPRITDGVVVWCEQNGGSQEVHRYVLSTSTETVIAQNVAGNSGSAHQPVVTEDAIFWASGEDLCRIDVDALVSTPFEGCPQAQRVVEGGVGALSGAHGERVAYTSGGNGVQREAAYYDDDTGTSIDLTDDILDQTDVDVWRDRIVYADRRRFSEDIVVRDLTESTFLVAHPALQAAPATDDRYAVWADARAGVGLYVFDFDTRQEWRLNPEGENVAAADTIFSLADGKVAYAASVAPDTSETLLYVHDIATDTRRLVSSSLQHIQAATLDDTGTRLVWFDPAHASLQTTTLTGITPSSIEDIGGSVTQVRRMGVVADAVVYVDNLGGGNDPVQCARAGSTSSTTLASDGRGVDVADVPSVGRVAVWGQDDEIRSCKLTCGTSCPVEVMSTAGAGSTEDPKISSSGYVVWMSNKDDDWYGRIAVRDLLLQQTFKLNSRITPTDEQLPVFDPNVHGGRVVWSGFDFGNSDIFMAELGQ